MKWLVFHFLMVMAMKRMMMEGNIQKQVCGVFLLSLMVVVTLDEVEILLFQTIDKLQILQYVD